MKEQHIPAWLTDLLHDIIKDIDDLKERVGNAT